MCEDRERRGEGCRCRGRGMRNLVQPRLLLQLVRKPAHGYELMEALGRDEDEPAADPGSLYRTLRLLEEEGLVRSTWETGEAGPARRVYELTGEGVEYLHTWAVTIRGNRARLDRFLADYERQFQIGKGA